MAHVVYNQESVVYDGTNGTFICSTWLDVTEVSDNGSVLVYQPAEGGLRSANVGDYVIRAGSGDQYGRVLTPAVYAQSFVEITVP